MKLTQLLGLTLLAGTFSLSAGAEIPQTDVGAYYGDMPSTPLTPKCENNLAAICYQGNIGCPVNNDFTTQMSITCGNGDAIPSCNEEGQAFCKVPPQTVGTPVQHTGPYCERGSQTPVCLATPGENGSTVMKPFCKGKRVRQAPVLCPDNVMPTCDDEPKVVCGQALPQ